MKQEKKQKKDHKIIEKITITFFSLLIIFTLSIFVNKLIVKNGAKETIENINKIEEKKVSYVFLEINPKIAFTVKNDKVTSIACYNDDCLEIYEQINITGKSLIDSINYIYNYLKEKNYNINSATIKVMGTYKVKPDEENNIYVNIIDKNEQEQLLQQIINNDEIKEQTELEKHNYTLWEEMKKDKDYDKIYNCRLSEKNLECYLTNSFIKSISEDITPINVYKYIENQQKLMNTLDKFKIKYETSGIEGLDFTNVDVSHIYINNTKYRIGTNSCYNTECLNKIHVALYDEKNTIGLQMNLLPLEKLELLTNTYNELDVILLNNSNGTVVSAQPIAE